jgi:hypothetical protein
MKKNVKVVVVTVKLIAQIVMEMVKMSVMIVMVVVLKNVVTAMVEETLTVMNVTNRYDNYRLETI